MSRSAVFLAVLLAAAIAPVVARAQRATLRGSVRDSAGTPVGGVEVMLSKGRRRAVTDSLGHYEVGDLPRREVTVRFRRVGYAASVQEVDLSRRDATLDVVMARTAHTLPPQVVSAARGGLTGVVGDTSSSSSLAEGAARDFGRYHSARCGAWRIYAWTR